MWPWLLIACIAAGALAAADAPRADPAGRAADPERESRLAMVRTIEEIAAAGGEGPARLDPAVLEVMRTVPRHLFVPVDQRPHAY